MKHLFRYVALWLLCAGCQRSHATSDGFIIPRYTGPLDGQESRYVDGMNYDPMDFPVGWTSAGELVVGHLEQFSSNDVYSSTCHGSGFYQLSLTREAVRPLAVGPPACHAAAGDGGTAMDPGARWVVYSARTLPNNSRLVRLELATGREDSLPTGCRIYQESPAWSADGQLLVTKGLCESRDAEWALYLMHPNGTELRRIAGLDTVSRESPALSPDAGSVAYQLTTWTSQRPRYQIAVTDTAGRQRHILAAGRQPVWSPDGTWIAYLAGDSGAGAGTTIRRIRPDGATDELLFRSSEPTSYSRGWGPIPEGLPSGPLLWTRDGSALVFGRRFDAGVSLWMLTVVSGELTRLTGPVDGPVPARGGA